MARKSFANIYNPDKPPLTTRFKNQGYSNREHYDIDQRRISYEGEDGLGGWKHAKNKVTKRQLEQDAYVQIGAVNSSWLTSLGYNPTTKEAVATFKGVNAEFFYKISYKTFLEWLNAPSKGKWLHDHKSIMENYRTFGGGRDSEFQERIEDLPADNRGGSHSDGTDRAKARVKKYLAKYR